MAMAWWACRAMDMAVTGTAITEAAALTAGTEARTTAVLGTAGAGMVAAGTAGEFTSAKKCWELPRVRAGSLRSPGGESMDASPFRRPTRAHDELASYFRPRLGGRRRR